MYGDESPILDNLQAEEVEQEAPKKKGGRTKEKNNARGIPEAIRIRFGYDTPDEETDQQRKIRLQGIRRYWAIRWYKYKSVPEWKWAMQFAFHPPFLYTEHMCSKWTEANRHLYYPKPPKQPHPTSLRTPDNYPEEQERLAIAAEKKRVKEEKKEAKRLAAEAVGEGQSSPKKKPRKLRKKAASPPHAFTDEEKAHMAAAALEDSMEEDDPAVEADDESELVPVAAPQKEKLRISMKKKPGVKPLSQGIKIQDPTNKPAARPVINTMNLVIEKPLASQPPAKTERRSKEKHDPLKLKATKKPAAKDGAKIANASKPRATVAKPGPSVAQVATRKPTKA